MSSFTGRRHRQSCSSINRLESYSQFILFNVWNQNKNKPMVKQWRKISTFRGWAREYFATTISPSDKDRIIEYIKTQPEHHGFMPIDEELRRLHSYVGLPLHENDYMEWRFTKPFLRNSGCLLTPLPTLRKKNFFFCLSGVSDKYAHPELIIEPANE